MNTTKYKPMTARDVLAVLQQLSGEDLDLDVTIEGCDCWGDVGKVSVLETKHKHKAVLVGRSWVRPSGFRLQKEIAFWRTDEELIHGDGE